MRHHFIPQFLLRLFTEGSGPLFEIDVRNGRMRRTKIRDAAQDHGLYGVFEDAIGKAESVLADAVKRTSERSRELSDKEWGALWPFVMLQLCRTPRRIRLLHRTLSDTAFYFHPGSEKAREAAQIIGSPEETTRFLLMQSQKLLTESNRIKTKVVHFGGDVLAIGDDPVMVPNTRGLRGEPGTYPLVLMPISKSAMVLFYDSAGYEETNPKLWNQADDAGKINTYQMICAERSVFTGSNILARTLEKCATTLAGHRFDYEQSSGVSLVQTSQGAAIRSRNLSMIGITPPLSLSFLKLKGVRWCSHTADRPLLPD